MTSALDKPGLIVVGGSNNAFSITSLAEAALKAGFIDESMYWAIRSHLSTLVVPRVHVVTVMEEES